MKPGILKETTDPLTGGASGTQSTGKRTGKRTGNRKCDDERMFDPEI